MKVFNVSNVLQLCCGQHSSMLIKKFGIPKVRKLRPETKGDILSFLKNEGNAHHEGARYSIIEFYMEIDAAVER